MCETMRTVETSSLQFVGAKTGRREKSICFFGSFVNDPYKADLFPLSIYFYVYKILNETGRRGDDYQNDLNGCFGMRKAVGAIHESPVSG